MLIKSRYCLIFQLRLKVISTNYSTMILYCMYLYQKRKTAAFHLSLIKNSHTVYRHTDQAMHSQFLLLFRPFLKP